jgi:hypothetical protein
MSYELAFKAVHIRVGFVGIPAAPFSGNETEGAPGVPQAVVKLHTSPLAESLQLFLAMIFQ